MLTASHGTSSSSSTVARISISVRYGGTPPLVWACGAAYAVASVHVAYTGTWRCRALANQGAANARTPG
jgi:hypothetical protein